MSPRFATPRKTRCTQIYTPQPEIYLNVAELCPNFNRLGHDEDYTYYDNKDESNNADRELINRREVRLLVLYPKFSNQVDLKGQLFHVSLDNPGELPKSSYRAVSYDEELQPNFIFEDTGKDISALHPRFTKFCFVYAGKVGGCIYGRNLLLRDCSLGLRGRRRCGSGHKSQSGCTDQ
jgi:hypothetical protein